MTFAQTCSKNSDFLPLTSSRLLKNPHGSLLQNDPERRELGATCVRGRRELKVSHVFLAPEMMLADWTRSDPNLM